MPRLPLRPPTMLENRHWPEHATHSAPCTKASISMSSRAQAAISSNVISRASTAREKPICRAARAPETLCTAICVLACSARWGSICFSSRATPKSCTMAASAPASAICSASDFS